MLDILGYLSLLTNWFSILVITLIVIHFYSNRNYNYWKSRGVNGPKPLPFIGNVGQLFRKARCLQTLENYKKFGKIHGIYEGSTPQLVVAVPELIRDILIKDFHKFVDRGIPQFNHPMIDRSLVMANGDQWKRSRVIVSPTFSTAKMRKMHKLIEECTQRLDTALTKIAESDQKEINVSNLMANYTMDVISFCAFATKINTYDTGADSHPFIKNSKVFFNPSLQFALYFILSAVVPSLLKRTSLTIAPLSVFSYFESTIKAIIAERESQKDGKYVDFLQLLIDAKTKTDNKDIDDDIKRVIEEISQSMDKNAFKLEEMDIMATSLLFILAGSETTSSTLSYLFHELALNPECQQRLYEEIKSCGESVDYDTISQLPYLDSCVNETLRKYPGLVFNQRKALEDYELGDTGLLIPKDMQIFIPTYAIHHDPLYYPDPELFNPDRFMPENKSQLTPYTFLPFGAGPRNCVGMRFAFMNIKTAVLTVLLKFRFVKTVNTKTEFNYKKFIVFTQASDMGTIGLEFRK